MNNATIAHVWATISPSGTLSIKVGFSEDSCWDYICGVYRSEKMLRDFHYERGWRVIPAAIQALEKMPDHVDKPFPSDKVYRYDARNP